MFVLKTRSSCTTNRILSGHLSPRQGFHFQANNTIRRRYFSSPNKEVFSHKNSEDIFPPPTRRFFQAENSSENIFPPQTRRFFQTGNSLEDIFPPPTRRFFQPGNSSEDIFLPQQGGFFKQKQLRRHFSTGIVRRYFPASTRRFYLLKL